MVLEGYARRNLRESRIEKMAKLHETLGDAEDAVLDKLMDDPGEIYTMIDS